MTQGVQKSITCNSWKIHVSKLIISVQSNRSVLRVLSAVGEEKRVRYLSAKGEKKES